MTSTRTLAVAATMAALITVAPAQEKGTAQKRDLSQGNTLYTVPYAHLDTQWRWSYPQVIREFIWNTMADNLKLIDKYPHYVFNFSGSRRYEMMREYYPEEYAKVVAAVKAGRWFPCGSSVDEGDANVPSSESIIRHVLYGNNWFRKNLGVASQEFMLPDCFGFPYALPTILRHCGLDGFSTQKLTWGSPIGIPFKVGNWIGPDGSAIVAALDPGSYGSGVNEDLSTNTSWLARIQNTGKQSGAYVDYHYYGTGDRGGAPGENSAAWVEKSIAGKGPISVVSTRADEMFVSLTPQQKAKLPSYQGELLLTEHSAGSITSQAHMKRWNRKNELLADGAERASVAANLWAGTPYPYERLYTGWDLTLGSQMHDMLPGTSLPKAYEYCYNDYLLALNTFAAVETDGVGAVASAMETKAPGIPLVVYNPLSIARTDVVEAWVPMTGPITVFGPNGQPVPTQVSAREAGRTKVLFLASMPPTGFTAFDARPVAAKQKATVVANGRTIDSPRFTVKINEAGDIASIYDKATKHEVLKAPTRLDFQHHNPREFPAWNMDWNDAKLPPYGHVDGPAKIRVVENGPVRATIEVERESNGSKYVQRIRLAAGGAGDRVEVENLIDWSTRETALKAAFPLTCESPKATYDLQAGAIERGVRTPGKFEYPQHQWFDQTSTDGKYGVAILNDSKFGSDKPSEDTVRLTLLYTPGVRGGYQDQAVQDFGKHDFVYAIAPHAGDWRQGNVAWTAKRLNQPLRAFVVAPHAGRLGRTMSLASTSTGQVELQAIKRAEDGNGFIVRLRELTGKPATNVLVKMSSSIVSAEAVDGQERPLGKATTKNGALVANVRGFGIAAYRVGVATTRIARPQPASQSVALNYDLDVASTQANDKDGAFDEAGRTYAAEMLPSTLKVDGINFKLGDTSDGAKNALAAKGQTIALPKGYDRVYVLAAATADTTPTFKVGSKSYAANVPAWDGYVGQWDTRLWVGTQPELSYNWPLPFAGVKPGYVKKAEVAWYASHRHLPGAGNGYYEYTYLFKSGFDVPKGATSITLPNDPRVRIFAISVAKGTQDDARPAAPLYDTLDDHQPGGAPKITVSKDANGNGATVTLQPPVYFSGENLHFTTDGTAPTAASPKYDGPLFLAKPTTIRVVQIQDGTPSPEASLQVDASDTIVPKIISASVVRSLNLGTVEFSERVDRAAAENPASYAVGDAKPTTATLSPDGQRVTLTFADLPAQGTLSLSAAGVMDLAGNRVEAAPVATEEVAPVFTSPILQPGETKQFESTAPTSAKAPWTINLWLLVDKQPEDRTLIAGFGSGHDGEAGKGRYLTKFPGGINFWSAQQDVQTRVPLDVQKWQMLTATYDGSTLRLYKNGRRIAQRDITLANDVSTVNVLPVDAWEGQRKVDGEVRGMTIWGQALPIEAVQKLYTQGRG
jgi:alpha-mannosidase